jgi:hypothetical protein
MVGQPALQPPHGPKPCMGRAVVPLAQRQATQRIAFLCDVVDCCVLPAHLAHGILLPCSPGAALGVNGVVGRFTLCNPTRGKVCLQPFQVGTQLVPLRRQRLVRLSCRKPLFWHQHCRRLPAGTPLPTFNGSPIVLLPAPPDPAGRHRPHLDLGTGKK